MTEEKTNPSWTGSRELHGQGTILSKFDFPKDERALGGAYRVDENAELLQRYFLFERLLLRAQAGWLMGTPEFEVKVEYGRHIYYHSEAAMKLRTRLTELRSTEDIVDSFTSPEIEEVFRELISAESPAHFLAGVYGVLLPHLISAYTIHTQTTDQVADAPTIRILKQILSDYTEMYLWGKEALDAYVRGGYDGANIVFSQMHLEQVLNSFGGVTGRTERSDKPAQLRSSTESPFQRSFIATRDPRFTTFEHTYEYKIADKGKIVYNTVFDETALNLIRSQRDELDAIETFSNVLYEIRDVPFGFDYDIARIIYDETRHTELGHKALQELGYDPFDLANRLLGIKVRTKMPAEYSFAEINLFGEANIVQEVLRHSREAYSMGDELNGKLFDYVNADERTHLSKGIRWLKYIFKTDSVQEITQKTKDIAIKRLLELGIIDHEVALTISHKELAKIIGE
ncbi:MAG: DUF455 family protein [Bacteroidota bacterium]|nr:DUF455 family protein [Bacteroidota bacterium]MDP4231570.1 DUF455 family protein [Bacteroidota bacterium]MDP4235959.1 DUF455 family protein [Bacteroidota bacterium]